VRIFTPQQPDLCHTLFTSNPPLVLFITMAPLSFNALFALITCLTLVSPQLTPQIPLAITRNATPGLPPNTNSPITWHDCGLGGNYTVECGRPTLRVPLDYFNHSRGNVSLSVVRLRADPKKRRGTIFSNPGGPGVPGTGYYIRTTGVDMMRKSGGEYDIVR
jgi:hypothetical protein